MKKRIIFKIIMFLIFSGAVFSCLFVYGEVNLEETKTRLPILMYHRVGLKTPDEYWLKLDVFEEQIQALKKAGFQTVTFSDVEAYLKEGKKLPPRAVILTFDDGYQDFYLYVYPVLKQYGYKATVFIITGQTADDEKNRFDSRWEDDNEENLSLHLIWPEIKEMADYGIEIGGHSERHPCLNDESLTEEDLWREINGCKETIEEKLGRKIIAFAYPGGRNNEKVRNLVKKSGYKFAVISGGGVQEDIESNDPFAFRRMAVFNQDAASLLSEISKKE